MLGSTGSDEFGCGRLPAVLPYRKSPPPTSAHPRTARVQVNYVGKAGNLYTDAGYKLSGSSYVVEKYLGTTWLWDKVRTAP